VDKRGQKLIQRSCELFSSLCDPNRLTLLLELARADKRCSVSELARFCPVDLSVVSRHLDVLRRACLVEREKQGREVLYSVQREEVARTLRQLADAIESQGQR
jgi:DNA-binding transcriptional ArsR family regulator